MVETASRTGSWFSIDPHIANDPNGNLATITKTVEGHAPETSTRTWNAKNQLTQVTHADGQFSVYSYMPDSPLRRLHVQKDGTARGMLWDPETLNLVEDFAPGGSSQANHSHELGMDELLVTQGASGRQAILRDRLSSVRGLANEVGAKVNSYTYRAFGQYRSTVEGVSNRFGFTGREWDAETLELSNRWRHYRPDSGRWTQPDPIGFLGGTNLQAYVGNNPATFGDPSGLEPMTMTVGGIGTILGGAGGFVIVGTTAAVIISREAVCKILRERREAYKYCDEDFADCMRRDHSKNVVEVYVDDRNPDCGDGPGVVMTRVVGQRPATPDEKYTDCMNDYITCQRKYLAADTLYRFLGCHWSLSGE